MNIEREELSYYKSFCKILADKSAEIIRKYFRTQLSVDSKSDNSPVTIADKSAEELMRKMIEREFPNHGIIGEEFGIHNPEAIYKWILDPIDGTRSFISGALSFGTLISLTYKDAPVIGVINHPILNEFLIGGGAAAELNGEKVSVRNCSEIENATLLNTDHFAMHKYQNGKKFDALAKRVKLYRQWGDCYGYYLVATGFADVMIDPIMSYWDKTALIPIIQGAGGIITDYQGNDANKGNSIIAASPGIHKRIIDALN